MKKAFIKATENYCTEENFVSAPYLRRSFNIDKLPQKAEINICGLGFYRLFINGKEITKGLIAPYISSPDDLCYYDNYDLTSLLATGKNVIGVILGNGFMNGIGSMVWDGDKAPWRGTPRLAAEVYFTDEKGNRSLAFSADESFKVAPSPIIFDDVRYGEYYDARQEIEGWALPELDDTSWQAALPASAPKGEMRLCGAEPIGVREVIRPVEIIKSSKGYVYDFGKNSAGICELNIKNATTGQKIELRFAELVQDGELFVNSITFSDRFPTYHEKNQKDIYICREGDQKWRPGFTYHGFRYVLVEGITEEQATSELLTYYVMNSTLAVAGDFRCSDERVNAIVGLVKNADLSNFHYFPTDCPHREKNGWTGDIAASCYQMMMLYNCHASYSEWLVNARKSQNENGVIPGIVPTAGWGYNWGNGPAWDRAVFYLPYECWRLYGDTQIIEDNADMMEKYLPYMLSRKNEDGTLSFGLGDWASVGRRFSRFETPLAVSDTILGMDIARKAAEMLAEIGRTEAAELARSIYEELRETTRRELLDKETCTLRGRTQTAQAMGLYHGIFEPDEERKAFDVLIDIIHEKGDSFDCGIIGIGKIFHILSKYGEGELAFHMITKKEFPSYGRLVDIGETALPEHFMPDDSPLESHNHHFQGDVVRWFIREIGGLRVENSRSVIIRPDSPVAITSAEAYYELPTGRVSVKWQRGEDGMINLEYSCPKDVECKVILPNGRVTEMENTL